MWRGRQLVRLAPVLERLALSALCMVGVVLVMFLRFFPGRIAHWRNYRQAPWPADAFGQTLAWSFFLSAAFFILFFGWLPGGRELLPEKHQNLFPDSLVVLNEFVRWAGLLVVAAMVSLGIRLVFRHRGAPGKPVAPGK